MAVAVLRRLERYGVVPFPLSGPVAINGPGQGIRGREEGAQWKKRPIGTGVEWCCEPAPDTVRGLGETALLRELAAEDSNKSY